ncbi:Rho-N domain-containing protein 1 [Cardamine amara subsp. amara]|uniref:Rho-N domain-containing protein 1 n=1 Tax=Cardamine amara subsp. amara TaxID=228776 RepID=A0ABD0ZHK0_CARAN
MAFSGTLQLTSDYVPGYGASVSRGFPKSAVSRRTLAVIPCSSCLIHKLRIENCHLKSAPIKTSFVCRASSSGHRRNNPDFSRNNNKHGFRGRNRRNEDRDGLEGGGGLEDSEMLSSKNGPILSLSSSPKFQATSSPGPREKEIVNLFRKVQAQLRARAAAKKEDRKTEEASKGQGGKESETVDSLLKLLRKHSGEPSKKQVGNFNSEKQLQGDNDAEERHDHSSNRFDSRNRDHNATPFTRPASSFRRNSPVPRHKSQASYSSEAIFDQESSYSVTWTQKKDQVESRDELEYEPEPAAEYEPETEPELAILESESELKPESFYQEENEEEEDHDVALDELSDDDDESLNTEEETVKEEDLSALKLIELRAIAKSRGLKGISKMKKGELVNLLGSSNKA